MPYRSKAARRSPAFAAWLAIGLTCGATAAADESAAPSGPPSPAGWELGIGVAPVVSPVFEGADDIGMSVFPDIRVRYRDRFLASVPDGIRYRVVNGANWRAGPIARIRFGREEDNGGSPFLVTGSADALSGLGDVDTTLELGGFVAYRREHWRARLELRRGVGGHEGIVGDVSTDYTGSAGRIRYAFGPRMRFGGAEFTDTYFGIDAGQSARSGLPTYDAGGGVNLVGVGGSAVLPYGRRLSLVVFGGYDRLLGDIADAPLVERRGSRNQLSAGAALTYRFDLSRPRRR